MWDKLSIRIPFKESAVIQGQTLVNGKPIAMVDPNKYPFEYSGNILVDADGNKDFSYNEQHWGTIPTSISETAIGFMPRGQGQYTWPCVCIKASPSKILQGHNVFGTEKIKAGAMQMLANAAQAFPEIWKDLELSRAEVMELDSTYSALQESEYKRNALIQAIEDIAPRKDSVSRYKGYIKIDKDSERRVCKVYYKLGELLAQYEKAFKERKTAKAAILGDPRLQEFAFGRLRFEATTKKRALLEMGVPTRLEEFLTFNDWFERVHGEPLCRHLWHKCFDKYLSQLEGQKIMNLDDDNVRLLIDKQFLKVRDDGRVCRRRANAVWNFYRQLKIEGYEALRRESRTTVHRNISLLEQVGLSKAYLKALRPDHEGKNVIPLVSVIDIDFSNQRPSWYQEPAAGFEDERRHLRLVS